MSKFKAFAYDNWNFTEMPKVVSETLENISGKGEKAVHQHFLLFPQCFPKFSFSGLLKLGIVGKLVKLVMFLLGCCVTIADFQWCYSKTMCCKAV